MDSADVRILRAYLQSQAVCPMNIEFRKPYRSIASKVGLDEDTVRNRIKRFHRTGLLGDWHISVNPQLLGGGEVGVWFDVDPALPKDALIEKLKVVQGVFIILRFYGRMTAAILRYDTEASLRKQIELIRRLSNVQTMGLGRIPYPECGIRLSRTDWDILGALLRNPRESYVVLSEEVGLSSRTVKRRLQRMIQGRAVFALPSPNPKAIQGSVMAALLVSYPMERKEELDGKIAHRVDDYLWYVLQMLPYDPAAEAYCAFDLMLPNVSHARELENWARERCGLPTARVDLFEDIITLFESLDEHVERRLGHFPSVR